MLKYKYADGNYEELIIGAELFHILMELKDGVQLSDAASDDTFANLSIFTQRLAHENSREFSAWNPVEEVVVFKIKAELKDDIQKNYLYTCSTRKMIHGNKNTKRNSRRCA